MSTKPNNPPAFPVSEMLIHGSYGMTLRDWFAGQALAGWLASFDGETPHPAAVDQTENIAKQAYALATAMLTERERQP